MFLILFQFFKCISLTDFLRVPKHMGFCVSTRTCISLTDFLRVPKLYCLTPLSPFSISLTDFLRVPKPQKTSIILCFPRKKSNIYRVVFVIIAIVNYQINLFQEFIFLNMKRQVHDDIQ